MYSERWPSVRHSSLSRRTSVNEQAARAAALLHPISTPQCTSATPGSDSVASNEALARPAQAACAAGLAPGRAAATSCAAASASPSVPDCGT